MSLIIEEQTVHSIGTVSIVAGCALLACNASCLSEYASQASMQSIEVDCAGDRRTIATIVN